MKSHRRSRTLFDATVDQHREAASTAPLNTRVPGSPEWCYQTMGLLKSSYRLVHIDEEDFTRHLDQLREHRAWEKVPVDHPYGTEDKMLIAELGKRVEEIEAELSAASQELREQKNKIAKQALDKATPNLKDVGHPSSNDSDKTNDATIGTNRGSEYAIAKLRAARPDIHQRVLDGELSPNAGMVEAGFRKKPKSRKMTTLARIKKLLPKLTDDEREELRQMLE